MPISDPTNSAVLELSRAEQWVVHHVLLDSIGLADGTEAHVSGDARSADTTLGALEKLEARTFEFTAAELALLRSACQEHARATEATADRNLASAVADRIGVTVGKEPRGTTTRRQPLRESD